MQSIRKQMSKEPPKTDEHNRKTSCNDLQDPAVVKCTLQEWDVHMEDDLHDYHRSRDHVRCLPKHGELREKDINAELLGVGEGKASLVDMEHCEEDVASQDTQENCNCEKNADDIECIIVLSHDKGT